MKLHKLFVASSLALAAAGASPAVAETKLTTSVYTASPAGFLVTSTLVAGDKEAILIDGQFTLADAHRLAAMILESKKTLTTVYVTHAHPDHYFGLTAIKQAFPKVQIVARPSVVKEIEAGWRDDVKQWGPMYGDQITHQPIIPAPLKGTSLTLEGQTLEIKHAAGDAADGTYLWIPSTKTVVAGDIVYRGVHAWTAEGKADARRAWIKSLDEIGALGADVVIAGHKDPKLDDKPAGVRATRDYLEAFDAAVASSKTAAAVQDKLKPKYGDLQLDIILQLGAAAQFAPAPAASKK